MAGKKLKKADSALRIQAAFRGKKARDEYEKRLVEKILREEEERERYQRSQLAKLETDNTQRTKKTEDERTSIIDKSYKFTKKASEALISPRGGKASSGSVLRKQSSLADLALDELRHAGTVKTVDDSELGDLSDGDESAKEELEKLKAKYEDKVRECIEMRNRMKKLEEEVLLWKEKYVKVLKNKAGKK